MPGGNHAALGGGGYILAFPKLPPEPNAVAKYIRCQSIALSEHF